MKLVVTDFDNTLYDWVGYFVPCFYRMLDEIQKLTGIGLERLCEEFQAVHRQHHNSEHPFAALEVPSIQVAFGTTDRQVLFGCLQPAFEAFRQERRRRLHLFPGVAATLAAIRSAGVRVVGHTEATLFNARHRVLSLGLATYIDRVYVLEGAAGEHPDPTWDRSTSIDHLIHQLPKEDRKPNPDVLRDICRQAGARESETVYVGDSVTRDIYMAKEAGVTGVWAKYGRQFDPADWERLVAVTHWTPEDVRREEALRNAAREVRPDWVIDSFSDLLPIVLRHNCAARE